MKSKTKFYITNTDIEKLFESALSKKVLNVTPLKAGEFNSVYKVECAAVAADNSAAIKFVLKVAPHPTTDTLTFEKGMLLHEVNIYSTLQQIKTLTIPKVLYSDFSKSIIDSEYFIMEYIKVPMLSGLKVDSKFKKAIHEKLAEFLAEMHNIDAGNKFGYPHIELFDNWFLALTSIIENLKIDANKKNVKLLGLKKLLYYIEKNKAILKSVPCSLVNFDLWDLNIFVGGNSKDDFSLSIVDPERSFYGDPMADFVTLMPLKNLNNKQFIFDAYNKRAKNTISLCNNEKIRYYIMHGVLSLIMQTERPFRYRRTQAKWFMQKLAARVFMRHCLNELKKCDN